MIKLLLASLLIMISCSKDNLPKTSRVTFTFNGVPSKSVSSNKSTSEIKTLSDPTSTSEITCFGILARYPEQATLNYCNLADATVVAADEMAGMAPFGNGGILDMEVKVGNGRVFSVVGWKTTISCFDVHQQFDETYMSAPFLLGQAIANVGVVPMTVPINVSSTINPDKKFGNCYGTLFEDGGTGANYCPSYSTFANITFSTISCYYSYMSPALHYLATGDDNSVYLFTTSNGNYAKVTVGYAATQLDGVQYQTYSMPSGALLSSGASISIPSGNCIDLDVNDSTTATNNGTTHDFCYSDSTLREIQPTNSAKLMNLYKASGSCGINDGSWNTEGGGCKDIAQGLIYSAKSPSLISWHDTIWDSTFAGASPANEFDGGRTNDYDPADGSSYIPDATSLAYCHDLVESGYSDWRVPTFAELQTSNTNDAVGHMQYTGGEYIWSSTRNDASTILTYRMGTASQATVPTSTSMEVARCVRN